MKRDWTIVVSESWEDEDRSVRSAADLLGVWDDMIDATEAADEHASEFTQCRVYIYHWERNGFPSLCGVIQHNSGAFAAACYGRAGMYRHGDALLEAFHLIYLQELDESGSVTVGGRPLNASAAE